MNELRACRLDALSTLLLVWMLALGACTGEHAAVAAASSGAMESAEYFLPGDFKFPPIRGDDSLVEGPLGVDEILDLSPAGRSPFFNPNSGDITYSGPGGLWRIDSQGNNRRRLGVDLGGSGYFLTPQFPDYSPNGEWLSYVSSKSGTPELWLWSDREGRDLQLTNLGFDEINAYAWSPDGNWIAFSANRHGGFDIWKVQVPSGTVHRLTSDDRFEVYPTWAPDATEILYVRLDEAWVNHDVMRMTASGRDPRRVAADTDFFDYGYGRTFGYPLISPDATQVVFRSHRSGWINYWTVPLEGGAPRPFHSEDSNQSDGTWSPDGAWFAYTSNRNGTHDLRLISADGKEVRTLTEPDLGIAGSPRWSPDGSKLVFTVETPTLPREIHMVGVEGGASQIVLGSEMREEVRRHLVSPEKITYPSTDGLSIPAYLYRPPGASEADPLPAILWIHGGPTSQWHDSFHAQVQFFVQEGFVVLMPNIRGSSGYGKDYEELNEGCWGHCDLEDVKAGVDYLKSLPYVDVGNLGIQGSSYGGIMSMAAAAFAPGLFQAAVPQGGYADWIDFYHGHNELHHIKLLEHDLGAFEENEDVWRRSSSIYAVADIATPMLLVHGVGRYPVYRQTYDFARAMQRYKKPFRYNIYPGENYYLSRRENIRQFWLDMLAFLDQQLRDGVVSGSANTVVH